MVKETREALISSLAVAAMESYTRTYPSLVQLQMLRDLEVEIWGWQQQQQQQQQSPGMRGRPPSSPVISPAGQKGSSPALMSLNLEVTADSFRDREAILNLSRLMLELRAATPQVHGGPETQAMRGDLQRAVKDCWIRCARLAREAGYHHVSYAATLQVASTPTPQLFLEKALGKRDLGNTRGAIVELEKGRDLLQTHPATGETKHKVSLFFAGFFFVGKLIFLWPRFLASAPVG